MNNSIVYLKVIGAIFLWATTATAGKILTQHMSPMMVLFCRFFISAILMYVFLVHFSGRKMPRLKAREWLDIFIIALIGLVFHNYLLFKGITYLPVTQTNIILATTPIFVSIGAALFMGERISPFNWIGIIITIIGSAIVITNGHILHASIGPNELKGILYLVGVMIVWTVYIIITRDYPERLGMEPFILYCFFLASIQLVVAMPAIVPHDTTQWTQLNLKDLICIIFFVISTVFPYSWYFEGIQKIGPSRTVIFTNLMPIFGIAQAIIILHEKPGMPFYIGTVLTILGILFVNKKKEKAKEVQA